MGNFEASQELPDTLRDANVRRFRIVEHTRLSKRRRTDERNRREAAQIFADFLEGCMGKKVAPLTVSETLMLVLMASPLGLGEMAIRSVHLHRDGIPFFESNAGGRIGPITLDQDLGWKATEHYQEALVEKTQQGTLYPVRRSQTQYGFRQFEDLKSTRLKMLIVGDSFTHATAVSDDRTYHALLSKPLDIEVFAYGVGGYGTLQEFLILDRYLDIIRPDVVLWQYCINDVINNDNELERLSRINNNGWVRPYWVNGRIKLLSPKESSIQVWDWVNRHSRFLYFVLTQWIGSKRAPPRTRSK